MIEIFCKDNESFNYNRNIFAFCKEFHLYIIKIFSRYKLPPTTIYCNSLI